MEYPLLVVSRIDTDLRDPIIALTFYPTDSASIKPRAYETLVASYVRRFEPPIELADSVSEKGKRRLKLILRRPKFTEDERRSLGTLYYGMLFRGNPGNDEGKKGAADTLYNTVCDLYRADASSEESWTEACDKAVARIQRLAAQYV